jgi:hypothetical protein
MVEIERKKLPCGYGMFASGAIAVNRWQEGYVLNLGNHDWR